MQQQSADQTVAGHVDERPGCQADQLVSVREAEDDVGRMVVVRYPRPVRQFTFPELREQGCQGHARASSLHQDRVAERLGAAKRLWKLLRSLFNATRERERRASRN